MLKLTKKYMHTVDFVKTINGIGLENESRELRRKSRQLTKKLIEEWEETSSRPIQSQDIKGPQISDSVCPLLMASARKADKLRKVPQWHLSVQTSILFMVL